MSKYNDLVTVIDAIRAEAPAANKRYNPDTSSIDEVGNARARAFIHLFLKVKFGLVDFTDREKLITDDTDDGGIDGYYIDRENKKLYYIQSKFRATEKNFENKDITLEEILSMDIERITTGETCYESGTKYNGKIQSLIRDLQEISDIPKYDTKIILLANIKETLQPKINKIMGGYRAEIYNYERCYNELVFPLVSDTYYNISELKITINLDSTNSGHRIDYNVKTELDECNVNAFFVPTLEIAKIVSKYKNSILKYNPRSYLDLSAGSVNAEIAKSIRQIKTNEFALFNNGITMLSDNTKHSDKVGKKNKAEVMVTNPQIINGGQTAYTLSRLYDDCKEQNTTLDIFNDKEVLLKIITFSEENGQATTKSIADRLTLIEDISKATNQQSPVNEADRRANDKVQIELQKLIFEDFGLYYERKRGEFGDGLHHHYITRDEVIDRELFLRVCLAAQNKPHEAIQGQLKLFALPKFTTILPDTNSYRKNMFAYYTYLRIPQLKNSNIGHAASLGRYSVTSLVAKKYSPQLKTEDFGNTIDKEIKLVFDKWLQFQSFARDEQHNKRYFYEVFDRGTGKKIIEANWTAYFKGGTLVNDLTKFFK
ncbi:MAG TPA: AIPR family protein [Saprospiraceae bacterium]|nr:AIPR family protein [Saprospiraceae bacterium]